MTDEEICLLAGAGGAPPRRKPWSSAMAAWCACARPLFLAGGDSEDLFQEGMMGLLTAIRSFERERDASFRTLRRDLHPQAAAAPSGRPKAANTSL